MKKNPNTQVHRQGGKKMVYPQASNNKSLARSQGTAKEAQPVTLVFTRPDGSECARMPMPGQLFTLLKLAARQRGVSIAEFVEQAAWEHLKRDPALVKGGAR